MIKIINYFYIFSKLTTSLVLVVIILIMGYALINSYKNVDKNFVDVENQNKILSEGVSDNNFNYIKLKKTTEEVKDKIDEINKILNKKLISNNENQYQKDIKKLFNLNKLLAEKVDNINENILKKNNEKKSDKKIDYQYQVQSLISLLLSKYENGQNIEPEIAYLENILSEEELKILEKIKIINTNKFYGLEKLNDQFELDAQDYINTQFTNKNKNSILNFLFKFIVIKPSDLTIFENEELNILMQAKKFMERGKMKFALNKILLLQDNNNSFYKWINQINIYIDFKNEIEKVV